VTTLAVAEEPQRLSGRPFWIERSLNVKAGRDPLGLQTITLDRIMPILLPGILVLSRRARYLTFLPFLLKEYERLRLDPTNEGLSEFVKLREFEYAVAVQLCPNGCGGIPAGAVGKDRAAPALNQLVGDAVPRQESVKSFLGGYGLYYRTPLVDLGLVVPRGTAVGEQVIPVDVLAREDRAQALADAFESAIADTAYLRDHMLGTDPVPVAALRELSERACLCRLPDFPDEQRLLREALFDTPAGQVEAVERDFDQRRRSFALFLRELGHSPDVRASNGAFRQALWDDMTAEPTGDGRLAQTQAQWASLVAKEYLQEAISCVFVHFWSLGLGTQSTDGLDADEVDRLIVGPLLGRGPLQIGTSTVVYDDTLPTSEFAAAVADASVSLSIEDLRRWAVSEETAISGLALAFVLIARLPDRETAPSEWARIGLQHSDRQPSLLGFAYLLEQHLKEEPTLAETLRWLTRRLVIAAHEQIAYSKLPDFTFRFRWEGGRLRFYPIGEGRFDLADMRRASMSTLSEDVGLWENSTDSATLTDEGVRFVSEVFG
jgi:hypothetical protein